MRERTFSVSCKLRRVERRMEQVIFSDVEAEKVKWREKDRLNKVRYLLSLIGQGSLNWRKEVTRDLKARTGRDVQTDCGLIAADFILGQVILGPLITCCWRSAWTLLDVLLDAASNLAPEWALGALCAAFGVTCANLLSLFGAHMAARAAGVLNRKARSSSSHARFLLISRCFTILSFSTAVMTWKGGWASVEIVLGHGPRAGLIAAAFGVLGAAMTGHARALVAWPLNIGLDRVGDEYFRAREIKGQNVSK